MRRAFRIARSVVAAAVWFLLAAAILQGAAHWILERQLGRLLGTEPRVQVRLFRLSVESPGGEGLYRGLRLSWKRVRLSGFGAFSADLLELGPASMPVARVQELRLSRVGALMRGRVRSVEASPLRPEWARLAEGSKGKGDWILRLPLDVNVESLKVLTPAGDYQGSAWVWGEGRGERGTWSLTLRGNVGDRVESWGGWNPSGGEGGAELSRPSLGSLVVRGGWSASEARVQTDLFARGQHLLLDGFAGRDGPARILLLNGAGSSPRAAIAAGFRKDGRPGGTACGLEFVSGDLAILRLPLSESLSLASLEMNVESVPTCGKDEGSIACIGLSCQGKLEGRDGAKAGVIAGKLNWDSLAGSALLVEATYWDAPEGPLQNQAPAAELMALYEASETGPNLARGTVRTKGYAADFAARHREESWEGQGRLRGPFVDLTLSGSWTGGEWDLRGGGVTIPEEAAASPLPAPARPLRLAFTARGLDLAPTRVEARGSGCGEWDLKLEGEKVSLKVAGADLEAAGYSVQGLDLALASERISFGGTFGEWTGKGSARRAVVSSFPLENLSFTCRSPGDRVEAVFGASMPSMDGEASGALALRPGAKPFLSVSSGALRLLGKDMAVEGLRAILDSPDALNVRWTCEKGHLFSESAGEIRGTVDFPTGSRPLALKAQTAMWGGQVEADLEPGGGTAKLGLVLTGIDVTRLPGFLKKWVDLPFSLSEGKADARVSTTLPDPTRGMRLEAELRDVTLAVGDKNHALRNAGGRVEGDLERGVFHATSSGLSMEKGAVPLELDVRASTGAMRVRIATPPVALADLQNAFFDFLPEFLGYGSVEGRGSVSGELRSEGSDVVLDAKLRFLSGGFVSEDKFLKISGIDGTVPVLFHLGQATEAVGGFAAPEPGALTEGLARLSAHVEGGEPLSVERVAYSVFSIDDIRAETRAAEGNLLVRILGAKLWEGGLRGEARLSLSTGGIRYAGQALIDSASLEDLCSQAGPIEGFISGDLMGSLTFGGEGLGLSKLKALLNVWVDPKGAEAKEIARDFLVKMGGERIRMLLRADVLDYDEASLRLGLDDGTLSFYGLALRHEADPIKGLMRKDVSYEVRIPQRNTISIWQLMNHIKALEKR